MAFTFTTPGLGPADYGGSTPRYGNMYDPKLSAGPRRLPAYTDLYNKESAQTGGGFGIYGPISGALQIAQGIMGYETQRKRASSFGDQADEFFRQANLALEQGFETSIDIGREGESFLGEQTVGLAKGGSLLAGGVIDQLAYTRSRIELNQQRVIEQSRRLYRAYYLQGKAAKKKEDAARKAGASALGSAIGGTFGTVFGLGFGGPLGGIIGSQLGGLVGQLSG